MLIALLISFTGPMTMWSQWIPPGTDAVTTATPLGLVKEALKAGRELPLVMDEYITLMRRGLELARISGAPAVTRLT